MARANDHAEPGQGPELERLTRRLAECPPEFLAEPALRTSPAPGSTRVDAVVADLVLDLGGPLPGPDMLEPFDGSAGAGSPFERNRLRLALVAAWLLHDDWFRERGGLHQAALAWLRQGLDEIAALAAADLYVLDHERREELARLCLLALNLVPKDESEHQALDRLAAISSVERGRVVAATRSREEEACRVREEEARKLREAMRKKRAAEAAVRPMHE